MVVSEIQRKKLILNTHEFLDVHYSIPLAYHTIFHKLGRFIEQNHCPLEFKTKTIKSTGQKTNLPSHYSLEDMWVVDTYTLKEGILVKKAVERHPDVDKRKLVIANKRGFRGCFIDEGRLGLTGNHKFYILGDRLELLQILLGFPIITMVCDYLKYGQSFLDTEVFQFIPDIRKLGLESITEEVFHGMIGLTMEEKNSLQ